MTARQTSHSKQKFNILKVAFVLFGQIEGQKGHQALLIFRQTYVTQYDLVFGLWSLQCRTKPVSSHSAQKAENSQAGLHQGLIRSLQCLENGIL